MWKVGKNIIHGKIILIGILIEQKKNQIQMKKENVINCFSFQIVSFSLL